MTTKYIPINLQATNGDISGTISVNVPIAVDYKCLDAKVTESEFEKACDNLGFKLSRLFDFELHDHVSADD